MIQLCIVVHTFYTVYYGKNKIWPIFIFPRCLRVRFSRLMISWQARWIRRKSFVPSWSLDAFVVADWWEYWRSFRSDNGYPVIEYLLFIVIRKRGIPICTRNCVPVCSWNYSISQLYMKSQHYSPWEIFVLGISSLHLKFPLLGSLSVVRLKFLPAGFLIECSYNTD